MACFPIKVDPFADESLPSLIIRVARVHRYGTISWIESLVGKRLREIICDREVALEMGALLREPAWTMSRAALSMTSAKREDRKWSSAEIGYCGNMISAWHLKPHDLSFCPLCLLEHGYERAIFALVLCGVCPEHGCAVLSHCPGCHREVNAAMILGYTCQCGVDLRRIAPTARYPEAQEFWRVITNRFISPEVPLGQEAHGPVSSYIEEGLEDNLALLAIFMYKEVRSGFAPTVERFVHSCAKIEKEAIAIASEKAIGRMRRWGCEWPLIVAEARDVIDRKTSLLASVATSLAPLMSWRLPDRLERLQLAVIDGIEQRRVQREASLDSRDIEHPGANLMSIEDAAALLGVRGAQAYAFFTRANPSGRNQERHMVLADEVWATINGVRRHARTYPPETTWDYATMTEAFRVAGSVGIRPAGFVAALASGEILAWFGKDERPTLSSLHMDRLSLTGWCVRHATTERQWLVPGMARAFSLMDEPTLAHLLRGSELRGMPVPCREDGAYHLGALADLCGRYVRLARLAEILNMSKFQLAAIFIAQSGCPEGGVDAGGALTIATLDECQRIFG